MLHFAYLDMTEPFWNITINAMNIIEITGFLANFIFVYCLLKEMRTSNYNQKTIELRNEMNAIFGTAILANVISNSTISLYIDHHRKLISHKNDSLLYEFYINKNVCTLINHCLSAIEFIDRSEDARRDWINNNLRDSKKYIAQKEYCEDIEKIRKTRHDILFSDREGDGKTYLD